MTKNEYDKRAERRIIHPATYRVRHDNGESFEVQGFTLARVRKLIEAECQDRGWDIMDTDYCEVIK